jgi:hypothetical protein
MWYWQSISIGNSVMNRTWKPIVAGVLDILSGAFLLGITLFLAIPGITWIVPTLVLPAILAIVGGVYAIMRRKWPMALAGSISAVLTLLALGAVYYRTSEEIIAWVPALVGISAVALTVLSKEEFGESAESAKNAKARDDAAKRISEETKQACKKIKSIPKKYRY